jgi:hypothetical protein
VDLVRQGSAVSGSEKTSVVTHLLAGAHLDGDELLLLLRQQPTQEMLWLKVSLESLLVTLKIIDPYTKKPIESLPGQMVQ